MTSVSITLDFPNFAAAQRALNRLAGSEVDALVVINHDDRPDVGAEPVSVATVTVADQVNPFVAVVQQPPIQGGNPFAVAAPEVAVAPSPPPPPPPAAVTVPTPPTAGIAPIGAPDVDSKGLPWDARIHGKTKSKNKDGSWRQLRGLDDEQLKLRVEAELRGAMAATAPPLPPVAPTAPAVSSAVAPASTPTASPATAPAAPGGETLGQVLARFGPLIAEGAVTKPKLDAALAVFGFTAIAQLAARPDLAPAFAQTADAMLAA